MQVFIILRTQVGYNGEFIYGDKVYRSKRKVTTKVKKLIKAEGKFIPKYSFRYVEKFLE